MSENRIEQYLDEPTSCPQCERAEALHTAAYGLWETARELNRQANEKMARSAMLNIDTRRMLRTAVRYFWYTGLALFAHVCVGLWIILGR